MVDVVIHCSDSAFGNAALITKWHIKERGWDNIGYHYVILNGKLSSMAFNGMFDGSIETGRPLDDDNKIEWDEVGAHVRGHNTTSIGICLIGKPGRFTPSQYTGLNMILNKLGDQFDGIRLFRHSDLDPKNKPLCPGLNDRQMSNIIFPVPSAKAGWK